MDNLVPVSSIEGDRKREEVPRRDAMVELERETERSMREG